MFILFISKWKGLDSVQWGKNNWGRVLEDSFCLIWCPVGPGGGLDSQVVGQIKWAGENMRPVSFSHRFALSVYLFSCVFGCLFHRHGNQVGGRGVNSKKWFSNLNAKRNSLLTDISKLLLYYRPFLLKRCRLDAAVTFQTLTFVCPLVTVKDT